MLSFFKWTQLNHKFSSGLLDTFSLLFLLLCPIRRKTFLRLYEVSLLRKWQAYAREEKCNNFSSSKTTQIYLKLPAGIWKIIWTKCWEQLPIHLQKRAMSISLSFCGAQEKEHSRKKHQKIIKIKFSFFSMIIFESVRDKWVKLRSCLLWIRRLRPDSEHEGIQQRLICKSVFRCRAKFPLFTPTAAFRESSWRPLTFS